MQLSAATEEMKMKSQLLLLFPKPSPLSFKSLQFIVSTVILQLWVTAIAFPKYILKFF